VTQAGNSERATLSTELRDFLVEFSIALHRTTMYPPGHPSQERSASEVIQRLQVLLKERPSVSIGVARHQMVIEGLATDSNNPVLRSLAEKFHKHHIGAISFSQGATAAEIANMMTLVAVEAEKEERPLGLGDPEKLRQWEHVRLYALTYDQLELVGDAAESDADEEQRNQGARSAQLWIGLAQAALSSDERRDQPGKVDPEAVAEAINAHPETQAYDQSIVGYLLQIAQELKQDGGTASAEVRRRMSKLIRRIDAPTLKRLVEMGGDRQQRSQFVLDAADSLPMDAVIEIVRASAESSGQTISHSLVRMLTKLSAFAESGSPALQAEADGVLRDQVRELVGNWTLPDPNPDAYTRALESLSASPIGERTYPDSHPPEPVRMVQMAIEVETVGIPFWRAVATLERGDGIAELISILTNAPVENAVAAELWARLANEETVRYLLTAESPNFNAIGALLDRFESSVAVQILLETIIQSESRAVRMGVFKRLVSMGPDIAPALIAHLGDARWYVKRNMLAILNELGHVARTFPPGEFARDSDPRVRREAYRLWMRIPDLRDRALLASLKDADDRVLRIGVSEALKGGAPDAVVPVIANRFNDPKLTTDLRLQLVRVLGLVRNRLAIDTLMRVVVVGKTMFGAPKLADPEPTVLVAISTLTEKWPNDERVKEIVERVHASKDPDLISAVEKASK
jgi:hypothetical protein